MSLYSFLVSSWEFGERKPLFCFSFKLNLAVSIQTQIRSNWEDESLLQKATLDSQGLCALIWLDDPHESNLRLHLIFYQRTVCRMQIVFIVLSNAVLHSYSNNSFIAANSGPNSRSVQYRSH